MTPFALRRHGLVRLDPAGWDEAIVADLSPDALAAIAHWRRDDLPLVVARQDGVAPGRVRLGLPAPGAYARVRVALEAAHAGLRDAGAFPPAGALEPGERAAWRALVAALGPARVFGSHGWAALTGLDHVHEASDVDLLVDVADAACADTAARILATAGKAAGRLPRLDGELVFPTGDAVAWREWAAWRAGEVDALLVKRVDGVRLVRGAWA